MKKRARVVTLGILAIATGPALAAGLPGAGDVVARRTATTVVPNESTHGVDGPFAGSFSKVGVSNDTQFGLIVSDMLTDSIDVELLASTPFRHELTARGGVLNGTRVGHASQLPPTLSVDYHFRTGTRFSPYVGVGVNYTFFKTIIRARRRAGTGSPA